MKIFSSVNYFYEVDVTCYEVEFGHHKSTKKKTAVLKPRSILRFLLVCVLVSLLFSVGCFRSPAMFSSLLQSSRQMVKRAAISSLPSATYPLESTFTSVLSLHYPGVLAVRYASTFHKQNKTTKNARARQLKQSKRRGRNGGISKFDLYEPITAAEFARYVSVDTAEGVE